MGWPPGDDQERLRQALAYAARGIPVLPLHRPVVRRPAAARGLVEVGCSCGDRDCAAIGKHPMTPLGAAEATTDPGRLAWWWRRHPGANVGLATGWLFDVLDVDGPESGDTARWSAVAQVLGRRGPLVRTGGDGWHFYLAPTGMHDPRVRGLAKLHWRGRGGWVVAPPSRHASGGVYLWVRGLDAPLPEVPVSLRGRLESAPPSLPASVTIGGPPGQRRPDGAPAMARGRVPSARTVQLAADPSVRAAVDPAAVEPVGGGGRAILERWLAEVSRAPKGERGHTLYRAGLRLFSLAAGGVLDRGEVEAGLLAAAERSCLLIEEPWQTRRTLALAERVGIACPAVLPAEADATPPPTPRTDRGA
jgi:Bifunctional DNA primase/polymerase, N-terminal